MAFSLKAVLGMDSTPFERGMKRMRRSVIKLSNRLAKMGLAAASAAVALLSRRAIKLGSYLSDVAESTGFATEEFQVFRGALVDAGGKAENMEKAILLMQKAVVQGSEGMTTYTRAFDRLGLKIEDLRSMKPEEQFQSIGKAIAGAEDQQGALTAAIEVFGQRNAPRLIEVFKRLDSEGYGKMAADIEKAYGIMDASTQKALDRAADQIERFKNKATIKVGELIAMEEGGAAFKILGLQLAKVASNFSTDLLHGIVEAGRKGGIAVAEGIRAQFSKHDFDTLFANALEQLPENQNSMLKRLGESNAAWYDDEIAKQQSKLEKARAESEKDKPVGAFGSGSGSGGGSGTGGTAGADENKMREYRLKLLKAEAEGNDKVAESMRRRIDFIQRVLKIERETNATREEALKLAKQQIMSEGGASGASGGSEFGRELKMSEATALTEGDREAARALVVRSRLEEEQADRGNKPADISEKRSRANKNKVADPIVKATHEVRDEVKKLRTEEV